MYSIIYPGFLILFIYTDATALEPRVFGGNKLRPKVHTYLVNLKIRDINPEIYFGCSGSVINQHWIISAAHCFPNEDPFIIVEQDVAKIQRLIASGKPSKIVPYPRYNHHEETLENYEADLALLKLEMAMQFDDWLQPIPLSYHSVTIGQKVTIAGYGNAEIGNIVPREGRSVITPCNFGSGYKMICTNSGVYVGSGDSGGALVSKGHLVGVTSSSCRVVDTDKTCQSVYVNVAEYIVWILNVIENY